MTIGNTPGILRVTNGPAPIGARQLNVDEHDCAIAAHLDHIVAWVGAWQEQLASKPMRQRAWVNRAEAVVNATATDVGLTTIAGRASWAFPDASASHITLPNLVVPPSYSIYVAMRANVLDTLGLLAHADATGSRLLLRTDVTGAIRADHGAVAADLLTVSNRWPLGSAAVIWSAFDAATMTLSLGGTVGTVVDLAAAGTRVLTSQHKGGAGFFIGNAAANYGVHTIGDVIVADAALVSADSAAHADIITNLAAKYGLSAA